MISQNTLKNNAHNMIIVLTIQRNEKRIERRYNSKKKTQKKINNIILNQTYKLKKHRIRCIVFTQYLRSNKQKKKNIISKLKFFSSERIDKKNNKNIYK